MDATTALGQLPKGLRDELIKEFSKIVRNFRERRWEAAELDGGRFSEIVYTILAGHLQGDTYPDRASKPNNFKQACERLASATSYPKSARLTMPRILIALYDVRNQRGVGHVGGDVDANQMDATFVLHTAQWVMAELVRLFHQTDILTATAIVSTLVERTVPLLWQIEGVTRILDPNLSLADGTLLLLYASPAGVIDKLLAKNLEQDRLPNYRRVLNRLHTKRLIEYNQTNGIATISPLGVEEVEKRLLP